MLVICGGALAIGAAAAIAMPFAPFALALTSAIAIGAGWAALHGMGAGQVALSAVEILVSTQVGYGLGLVAAATGYGARGALKRQSAAKPMPVSMPGSMPVPMPSPLSDLHLGEKP